MKELFEFVTSFITNKERHVSTKVAWVFSILLFLIIIDYLGGFSTNISLDNKYNQILKINTILADESIDKNSVSLLKTQRIELIHRKTPYQSIYFFFENISFANPKTDTINPVTAIPNKIESPIRNKYWFIVSSSGFYLILGLLFIVMYPFLDKTNPIQDKISIIVAVVMLILFICWLLYFLFDLIPLIGNNWTYNYILNFGLQILFSFLMYKQSKK